MTSDGVKPQSLRRDAVYVYSAYVLRYLSVLILVPYYGRVLGPTMYGNVLATMSLMSLVWMTADFGLAISGSRDMAQSADQQLQARIFSKQISARIILIPMAILVGAIGTVASSTLRANPWFGVLGTLLGIVNSLNLGWFYQGLRKFRFSLIFEAMIYPFNIMFVFLLVKTQADGIPALIALLTSTCIATVSAYTVALRIIRPRNLALLGSFVEIRASSTFFLQTANSVVMSSGSTYLLSVFSTSKQVGYFGSVEKLISFALAFLQPAAQVLMPTIIHRTKHLPGDSRRLVTLGIMFESAYGICACIGGLALARYVIPLAFGAAFLPSVPMLQIMVCALPFAAFTHSIGCYVLIPQQKERWLVAAIVAGNIVNLAIVAATARSLGGAGVSFARVAGECIVAIVMVFLAARLRSISFFGAAGRDTPA